MSYEIWSLAASGPVTHDDFYALPPHEADALAVRFESESAVRVRALESFVRSSPMHSGFQAECTPESCRQLALWLKGAITLGEPQPRSVEILNHDLPESIQRALTATNWGDARRFADPTLARSLVLDVGCLMAIGLREVAPQLRWRRIAELEDMDENKPALIGTWVRFSPYVQPWNVISRIVRGEGGPGQLWSLFELNRDHAIRPPPQRNTPIEQRDGPRSGTRCPRCGFGFARVRIDPGDYCNHCGHIDRAR